MKNAVNIAQNSIQEHAHSYNKWASLFVRFFTISVSERQDFSNLEYYNLKSLKNIYFLLALKTHKEKLPRYEEGLQQCKQALLFLLSNCKAVRELSIEIQGRHLPKSLILHYLVDLLQFLRHSTAKPLHLRFVLDAGMLALLNQEPLLSHCSSNTVERKSERQVRIKINSKLRCSFAIEYVLHSIEILKQDLEKYAEYKIFQRVEHISFDWRDKIDSEQTIKTTQKIVRELNFSPYQPWHFYRNSSSSISAYLENTYYLLPYLGIKINSGRGKTITWMQGEKWKGKTRYSAIGQWGMRFKRHWIRIEPWKELSLRCINGARGLIYVPYYLFELLGKDEMLSFKKREKFRTVNAGNSALLPQHDLDPYLSNGEFWARQKKYYI